MPRSLALMLCSLLTSVLAVSVPAGGQVPDEARAEREEGRSGLELVLEGIVVTPDPSLSVALVRRRGASRARALRMGENAYGFELIAVSEDAAVFEGDGRRLRLYLDSPVAVASAKAESAGSFRSMGAGGDRKPDPLPTAPSQDEQDERAEEGDPWLRRAFDRTVAEERLARDMLVIIAETGVAPRVQEGVIRGMRITRLPDGTLLSEAGLLPGDVLLSVNEVPVDSMAALVSLYPRLQSESEIRLVVERQGQVLSLAYAFR